MIEVKRFYLRKADEEKMNSYWKNMKFPVYFYLTSSLCYAL